MRPASDKQKAKDFIKKVVQRLAAKPGSFNLIDHSAICGFPDVVGEALEEKENKFDELVLQANENGKVTENLDGFQQDDWLKRLKTEGRMLDIVLILNDEKGLQLSSTFRDALHKHAEWVLNQQSPPSRLLDEWDQLLNALSDANRNSLLRSLQRTLLSKAEKSLQPALSMYARVIADSGIARDVPIQDPTETVNERFRPLLQRGHGDELKWLHDVLNGHQDLADSVDSGVWEAFRELIAEEYADASEDAGPWLRRIADLVDIDLSDGEKDDSANKES